MTQIAKVQLTPWFPVYNCQFPDLTLKVGDKVIVKIDNLSEIGEVIEVTSLPEISVEDSKNVILRKVTTDDLNIGAESQKQKAPALEYCKRAVERYNLDMKVIDAHFSFDGSRLIFPFIADGRIDFRELVKDLTHHFQKSIRLQQIGIRDEAKITGDFGSCGRQLCCRSYLDLKCLGSITSDLADLQRVSHRGSDRLTGQCGRLRCCLAFEKSTYEEMAKILPALGSKVKTPQGEGEVVAQNILKKSVDVAIKGDRGNIIEFPIN